MNLRKIILSSLLVLGASFACTAGAFADVDKDDWYSDEVNSAYEMALMNGTGGDLFSPEETLSVAEAITMAARAAASASGESIPEADGKWYQGYVNYGLSKGFISQGQFDSFERPAKRREVALLFGSAMPEGFYTVINDIEKIPDVSDVWDYHDALLDLYRAGVITGSDSYGNFRPEEDITRAEAAAIINRVAQPSKRVSVEFDKISDDDAYPLCLTNTYGAVKEGITSGWLLDNRGSTPRSSIFSAHGSIVDDSEEHGSAYIREFNKTSTGNILVQTRVSIGGYDGVYMEFRNDKGNPIFRLETMDGDWYMLNKDGSYTKIYEIGDRERTFTFDMNIDLDNDRADIHINYKYCGMHPLVTEGEDTNILNFRYATTEKGTPNVALGVVYMHGNYAVLERFSFNNGQELPIGWTGNLAYDVGDSLGLPQYAYATKSFNPVSGIVVAEAMVLLPKSEKITYTIKSGNDVVAQFRSDSDNFYVNGTKVYENYYANLWYMLRFEANTDTQTILVKVNGKKCCEVPFLETATSVDNIYLSNDSSTVARIDDIKVFRIYDREDYVPEPVVPKGEEDYIVGMNVCSLWQNENHFGWHCITPYDDPQPVLGYYDEGLAETADWELKYIIEHGIDFQAFCIYANSPDGHQRYGATHLYDGFMNAKYSDMSKFCVIWETANAQSPSSMDAWKKYYVPYFIEYYFKDPRHIVIDNRPVLCVFGANKIPQRLGGTNADVKAMFDYLEDEVRKLGFDGMIYLACGSSSASLAEMGFDGCYAYNWGNTGYQYSVNVNSIKGSANAGHVYTVPTISVGFNSIPWHGIRYPMMSKEDFAKCQDWVKDEYLATYPEEKWQENFVMLSTWNEYGEGTYMMPTTDEKGFRYLDVIREKYTDEKADASLNTIPTAEQRYRINRLYPQYRRLLRKEGYVVEEIDVNSLHSVYTIDYGTRKNVTVWSVSNKVVNSNGISGTTENDAIIMITDIGEYFSTSDIVGFKIKTKFPLGTRMQVFFNTEEDSSWSESRSKTVMSKSDNTDEYYILFNDNPAWKGVLVGIRIDPVAESGQPFTLKSLEVLRQSDITPKEMIINGQSFTVNFRPEKASNGDTLVAFDPYVGLDYRLNIFHEWNKDDGVLTLNFAKKVVKFTVGSNVYTVDGVEKTLDYAIGEIDGLPLVPMNIICDEVGYTMSFTSNGILSVDTDQRQHFDEINNRVFGQWEFNTRGDTESWSSSSMSLIVNDGYMTCESMTDSTDPILYLDSYNFEMDSGKYKSIEFRVRFKYDSTSNHNMQVFFLTDKNSNWDEAKSIRVPLYSKDSGGEWRTYVADLKSVSSWKDTITNLRFDPFNAPGVMDVDYIRFIVDEDYVPEEERIFEIKNGDAETLSNPSFGGAKIVLDPDNSRNHCFAAFGNQSSGGKLEYIYATQNVTYKPGATYKVSCDVRLAQHGGKDITNSGFKAYVLSNIRYNDPKSTTVDHVVARKQLTFKDGWTHWEYQFTIPEYSVIRANDLFSFYTDPVSNLGVGYYFDNVVVEEILPQ